MYNEPIFLKPAFQERIWGGKKLNTDFNYDIPFEQTGEAWVISAHPNGPSVIENGPLSEKTLLDAWREHSELFNKKENDDEAYPLLVKILDAADDLSVQVHPDDQFAREVEGVPYGKTECWYVLNAKDDAELILGHHANTYEELESMIDGGDWDQLLRRVKVTSGDFVYVPSGTIHAIGKGILILEIQQSSDITYRVYDYDRTDDEGNKRELHLDRAKQVTTVPHEDAVVEQKERMIGDLRVKELIREKYFSVHHWELNGKASLEMEQDFLQVVTVEGRADLTVDGKTFAVEKGDSFILPHGMNSFEISGEAEFVVSWPE